MDLGKYGSRGEQRLAVLRLKLAELSYIEKKTYERPLLLLDDIFSELDEEHRKLVLAIVYTQQTIITSAQKDIIQLFSKKIEVISL
jgi:DNA replication and repair protein RecF